MIVSRRNDPLSQLNQDSANGAALIVGFFACFGIRLLTSTDYGIDMALTQGKSALAKAIGENQPQMFEEAKTELDKAVSCKVGEALFLKALLFCNGLGVERDVPRGRRILREVISVEPQWALEIQANPKLCKAGD